MQSLENLIRVCNIYKKGAFDIEEFQSRIITAAKPDNLSKDFLKALSDFDNDLEKIVFCECYNSREKQGHLVADRLIQSLMEEQKRFILKEV